jgi:hypothetical protein
MPRSSPYFMLALIGVLEACPSTDTKVAPSKTDTAATKSDASDAGQPVAPPTPEGGFSEPPPPVPGPAPDWFRPDAFEHVAIIRQDLTGTRITTGQSSAMIVLELPAATTPEQCIEQSKAKLAESIKEPPIASTMPQGHLSLRGSGDGYEYTIVCGVAKGKPTMFLSYTQ